MLYPNHKVDDSQGVFVESDNIEELRAQRVWRLVTVLCGPWVFYTCFLWYRGYDVAAQVCLVDTLLHITFLVTLRNCTNHRFIMNGVLVLSAFGIFFVSISAPALGPNMYFFPVSILVASQLLGVGAAFSWMIVTIFAFVAYFVTRFGIHDALFTSHFDELTLLLGVACCVFFCCQQGEEYYRERTSSLIKLSKSLQKKSDVLRELATTDALTGLINRFQFQERLKEVMAESEASTSLMALFLIDMDGFKQINDTLGHPVGDDALREIAKRLRREYGHRADVARLGGDEFCIIYPDVKGYENASLIARRACELLTRRYELEEAEFPLGASVGFAFCPEHSTSADDLLSYADTAMFYAKDNHLGHACYEPEMTDRLVEYRRMQESLSSALENDEFFLVYQPQVDLCSGEVIGVEALLRWEHEGEVIPPYRFIRLLEQSREIIPVSKWIVREACRQLAEWNRIGVDIKMAINVSVVQFQDEGFVDSIADAINASGVNPRKIDCEITEGLIIDDVHQAVRILNQLKELGPTISVDDFGTGYSSLSYLRQFPLDKLKIDRAFIKDIPNADDGLIASSIIVLAKSLGLRVLAEGVETDAHIDFLKEHGCDEYQGYYMSRPVPADEAVAFFEQPQLCLMP